MDFDPSRLLDLGAMGICLGYFIYKDNKTSKELTNALEGLKEVVTVVKEVMTKCQKGG